MYNGRIAAVLGSVTLSWRWFCVVLVVRSAVCLVGSSYFSRRDLRCCRDDGDARSFALSIVVGLVVVRLTVRYKKRGPLRRVIFLGLIPTSCKLGTAHGTRLGLYLLNK